jgi:hypothetical protein
MWQAVKGGVAAVCGAIAAFFSTPFFFVLLGCSFIAASYLVLTKVSPCEHLVEMACLEYSQLNLAFGLLAALLGAVLLIYGTALHATHEGQISGVKQVYDEIKSFFGSPVFFILFGTFFLYCALVLLDETHSGFVFILAVLGIAMILFGTGSQAVASGNMNEATSGTFSVGIAGGPPH